jgi:hypothetical protein
LERKKLNCADDTILYVQNPKDSIIKLLGTINEFSKASGYETIMEKSGSFLYTNNELSKTKLTNQFHLQ